jgi:hypothetical protein
MPMSDFSAAPDDSSSKEGAPPTIHPKMAKKAMNAHVKKRKKKSKKDYLSRLTRILLPIGCLITCD